MASASEQSLIDGAAALQAGDWLRARTAYRPAFETEPTAEAAHGLARAEEWAGDFETAVRCYEQAFVLYRGRGEVRLPAVIAARELSFLHSAVYGNSAAAAGWLARARTLVDGSPDCVEAGWVHLAECLATRDPGRIREHASAATGLGRRFADPGLEFCGRSYEGLALVLAGHISEGLRLVDEATAAATGGEVRDYQAVGEIFCKMLTCSELTLDVRRAQQWMDVAEGFGRRAHAAWVPAICSTHYGGILTASGNWTEAEERLRSAVRDYDASYRALRTAAVVRLAELRLRQGRLEESAALLRVCPSDAYAVRPQAVLLMAAGEAGRAVRALARHLAKTGASALRAPELALLAEAHLRAGSLADAAAAGAQLSDLAATVDLAQYRALAEYVLGLQDTESGNIADAREHLESAAEYFGAAGLPLEEARSLLGLARLEAGDDPGLALAHARNAWAVFHRLGAESDVDAAARELRVLGDRSGAMARTGGRPAKGGCWNLWRKAIRTPRLPRGCLSVNGPSNIMSGASWRSSDSAHGRRHRPTRTGLCPVRRRKGLGAAPGGHAHAWAQPPGSWVICPVLCVRPGALRGGHAHSLAQPPGSWVICPVLRGRDGHAP